MIKEGDEEVEEEKVESNKYKLVRYVKSIIGDLCLRSSRTTSSTNENKTPSFYGRLCYLYLLSQLEVAPRYPQQAAHA
jgi:hypothetical protein